MSLCLSQDEFATVGLGFLILGILVLCVMHVNDFLDMSCVDRFSALAIVLGSLTWAAAELCEHRKK